MLLAPTLVLGAYGATHVSPDHLYRPLGVFTLVAAFAFGLIGWATRRWHIASFAVALSLLAVIGFATSILFMALAVWWLFLTWRSMRQRGGWDVTPQLTRPLNVLVSIWFGVASMTALGVTLPADLPRSEPVALAPGPNVYLVLLDGYPRQDTLMDYFGFDNRPFLEALGDRGFDIAVNSRSDYIATIQTVPTMMTMRPLEELLEQAWNGSDAQYRRLWQALNAAPIMGAYEAAGFTTYSIVSGAAGMDWRTADVVMASPWLSTFESHLIGDGILYWVLPLHAMQRATVLDAFNNLEAAAGKTPRFVFAHIYSPHPPYIFAADGGPAQPCGGRCGNQAGPPNRTLADRLIGQVRFLNGRVIEALDHIIKVDPKGIVIVFSDHGLRRDRADPDEWLRTLFAARGHSFPDDVTTLEVLPTLLR